MTSTFIVLQVTSYKASKMAETEQNGSINYTNVVATSIALEMINDRHAESYKTVDLATVKEMPADSEDSNDERIPLTESSDDQSMLATGSTNPNPNQSDTSCTSNESAGYFTENSENSLQFVDFQQQSNGVTAIPYPVQQHHQQTMSYYMHNGQLYNALTLYPYTQPATMYPVFDGQKLIYYPVQPFYASACNEYDQTTPPSFSENTELTPDDERNEGSNNSTDTALEIEIKSDIDVDSIEIDNGNNGEVSNTITNTDGQQQSNNQQQNNFQQVERNSFNSETTNSFNHSVYNNQHPDYAYRNGTNIAGQHTTAGTHQPVSHQPYVYSNFQQTETNTIQPNIQYSNAVFNQVQDNYGPNLHSQVSEKQKFQYPAIYVSTTGLITVLMKHDVSVETTIDQTLRLVSHQQKLVVSINNRGNASYLFHPAAHIMQDLTTTEAEIFLGRKVKMATDFITFANNFNCYKFDHDQIDKTTPQFSDLSKDRSVNFLFTDNQSNPELLQQCSDIISRAEYERNQRGGICIRINGYKIVQTLKGDVMVSGKGKYLRMSPITSVLRLDTNFVTMDVEMNWNVRIKRGAHALNASHLGLVVSNGKVEAAFDERNKVHACKLPSRRPLLIGGANNRRSRELSPVD